MTFVVFLDFLHDPCLCVIEHFLYERIVEIVGALLKAHGIDAVEQLLLCVFDVLAVNMP